MKSIIYTVLGVGLMAGMFAVPLPVHSADSSTLEDERYSSRFAKSVKSIR